MDEGRILASAELGLLPELAASSDGTMIAAVYDHAAKERLLGRTTFKVFEATGLDIKAEGRLPITERPQRFPSLAVTPVLSFSPDNRFLVVPSLSNPEHNLVRNSYQNIFYVTIDIHGKPIKNDIFGQACGFRAVAAPYSGACHILSSSRWPTIAIGDRRQDAVQIVDLDSGAPPRALRLSKTTQDGDDRARTHTFGFFIPTSCGRYAYHIPSAIKPGPIRLLDLSDDVPRIVCESDVCGDLSSVAAASGPESVYIAPSNRGGDTPTTIRVFGGRRYRPQGEMGTLAPCSLLAASKDGTQIYSASYSPPSITAIEVSQGKRARRFDKLVRWPLSMIPL